ncbi:MAG: hypothetical protein Sylvanvirus34_6 [Sylvanvirus sp.]|uniref:Uncharacterized protein n=1 Tax=Sylvanvirus sp. TaxID=2487774 RepID=A0A3G5AJ34_9VIRU|nr:MAG: hypothetical protein Sylvanvirus34_6 [Sylvanvirus sp.]
MGICESRPKQKINGIEFETSTITRKTRYADEFTSQYLDIDIHPPVIYRNFIIQDEWQRLIHFEEKKCVLLCKKRCVCIN